MEIAVLVLNRERILGSGHTLLPNITGSIPRVVATSMDNFPSAEGAGYLLGILALRMSRTLLARDILLPLCCFLTFRLCPQKRCVDINLKILNYIFIGCNKK